MKGWKGESARHGLASRGIKTINLNSKLIAKGSFIAENGSKGVTKDEVFTFWHTQWDVYKAAKLIEATPHKLYHAPIEDLFKQLSKSTPNESGGETITLGVGINRDYANTLTKEDCERPGIAIVYEDSGGLLIDGWHRIAACKRLGIENLPVYILTNEEAKKVAMNSLAKKMLPK